MNRRSFLTLLATLPVQACRQGKSLAPPVTQDTVLNDIHSRLNPTKVAELYQPRATEELVQALRRAASLATSVSISGGRHAMGGQQFAQDSLHLSMKQMNRICSFDRDQGLIKVEAGIEWPQLINYLIRTQEGTWPQWGIAQKQTGADNLSIGGAVSANVHGRGVFFKPFVQDIESLQLLDSQGELRQISRTLQPQLFSLVCGGYGLFGLVTAVTLRLRRRQKLERVVEVVRLDELEAAVRTRIEQGYLYGDYQYKTDPAAKDFMQVGVFSCYRPIADDAPMPSKQRQLSATDWNKLLYLAHVNKGEAYRRYSEYYLSSNGQRYWSDIHQLSYYNDSYADYLAGLDPRLRNSSLMITELYVPRLQLVDFTKKLAKEAKRQQLDIIYGTMRLIAKDDETFMPWARDDYACIIFNLRVEHSAAGRIKARRDFQLLIDCALEWGGSYFLTYHRWARKEQVLQAYPRFPEFLALKRSYDPQERWQSEWYRHYRAMFADELAGTQPAFRL